MAKAKGSGKRKKGDGKEGVSRREFMLEAAVMSLFGVTASEPIINAVLDMIVKRVQELREFEALGKEAAELLSEWGLDSMVYAQEPCACSQRFNCQARQDVSCGKYSACTEQGAVYGCTQRDLSCYTSFTCDGKAGTYNCEDTTHACLQTFNCTEGRTRFNCPTYS